MTRPQPNLSKKKSSKSSLLVPTIFISIGALALIFSLVEKTRQNSEPLLNVALPEQESNDINTDKVKNINANKSGKTQLLPPTTLTLPAEDSRDSVSDAHLGSFWITAKINFPVPTAMKYEKVSVDSDHVVALHGYNKKNGTDILVLARNLETFPSEIGPFMHETQLGKTAEKELSPRNFPAPERDVVLPLSTKLLPAKIWRFRGKLQDRVIALTNRADKKGSYLIVYTVPKGNINRTEEFLTALLKEAEAQ